MTQNVAINDTEPCFAPSVQVAGDSFGTVRTASTTILNGGGAQSADSEGVALSHLINIAAAEKISIMRTEEYFRDSLVELIVRKSDGFWISLERGNPDGG